VLIALAEHSGQIVEIGRWVLERAWSERARWRTYQGGRLSVSINVSARDRDGLVRDRHRAQVVLNDVKALGVKLALDDFGTGYSSLSYLMTYPIDAIKVDPVFVANLGRNAAGDTIVSAVIRLAHGLGMSVVAEGVETMAQRRQLVALGCDFCQGFYFARPMSAARLDTLLEHGANGSPPPLPELSTATEA
jgi:EAL domain-containing protein (putative c-di-GMP-specific phosphodiesterase class I)